MNRSLSLVFFRRNPTKVQTKFTELTDSQWQVIEKVLKEEQGERKRMYCLRSIINAIYWLTRTGCQWRNMESKYPKWEVVYYYFRKWVRNNTWKKLLSVLVCEERISQGKEPSPSRIAIDSQSVKKAGLINLDTGIDGGKKINGRKRHIAVDSLGLPIALSVSPANIHDSEGGFDLLWQLDKNSERLSVISVDMAYRGEFSEMVEKVYKWKIDIAQKPESKQGFVPQRGRWQVERSFGWLNFYRRLSKDYEKTLSSSLAFLQIAFCNIILARIT